VALGCSCAGNTPYWVKVNISAKTEVAKVEASTNKQSLFRAINEIISIIDKINREPVNISGYRQITGVISPFMSAVILPMTINYVTQYLPIIRSIPKP